MEYKNIIENLLNENDVCLFMKGNPDAPQCGFSMAVSNALKHLNIKFKGFLYISLYQLCLIFRVVF